MTDTESEAVAWRWRWEGRSSWNYLDYLPRPDADESEPLFPASSLASRDARITELEAENAKLRDLSAESIRLMTKYAREAGEATGKLETSELAGIVDDWKARALKAEALLEEAVKGLEVINEIWVEAKRHSPDDDFDRGSRAARAEASDLASATLTAIKGGE